MDHQDIRDDILHTDSKLGGIETDLYRLEEQIAILESTILTIDSYIEKQGISFSE